MSRARSEVRSRETMSAAIRTAHRYHDWVFGSFASHLRRGPTLEVGSGHGLYAQRLLERVGEVVVSDIDPTAIANIREQLGDDARVRYLLMDGVDPAKLGKKVANVLLLNVLEHIEDDAGLLVHCAEILEDGGTLVVFAPAFARLYGEMDRQAGHFRRYERAALGALIERAGFRVLELRLFNTLGFFGWWANKWLGSGIDSRATNLQIRLYDAVIPLVRHLDGVLPVGQSLVAVAEWRGDSSKTGSEASGR